MPMILEKLINRKRKLNLFIMSHCLDIYYFYFMPIFISFLLRLK